MNGNGALVQAQPAAYKAAVKTFACAWVRYRMLMDTLQEAARIS